LRIRRTSRRPNPIILADRARDAQQWDVAIHHYRTALARNPRNPPIWVQYGHALKEGGSHAAAEGAYRRAIADDPAVADTYLQLGLVLMLQRRTEEAKAAYLRALSIDRSLQGAADELVALGCLREDLPALLRAIPVPVAAKQTNGLARRRRRKESIITRADRARDLGQWEIAANLYRRALDRNPGNPSIWVQYGHAVKEGGYMVAEASYRRAIADDPAAAAPYLQLGHVLKIQGRHDAAEAAYLRAFALDPMLVQAPEVLGRLGWSAAESAELGRLLGPDEDVLCHDLHQTKIEGAVALEPPISAAAHDGVQSASARKGADVVSALLEAQARQLRDSGLFDAEWYFANYSDVDASGLDPIVHYLQLGAKEGRDPHPLFDSDWYLANNPEVLEAGLNPLLHYLESGAVQGRDPHPLFDSDWYLANYRDVAEAGVNPLLHYIRSGRSEGREPRPADTLSRNCNVLDIPFEIWRSPAPLTDRDVCLFVTYSPDGHIWDHVLRYLNSLITEQFAVVLVIATDGIERVLPPELDAMEGILVRANHGWDFAAWAAGLAVFPDLWSARTLILANDSIYGPISGQAFKAVVRRVRSSEASVFALTDSYEFRHHVQSYFTALTKSGLTSPAVRQFWGEIRSLQDKQRIIETYEVSLLDHLRAHNVSCEVLFPTERDGVRAALNNPTVTDWRYLLDRGFPFVKVQLIRDRPPQGDPTGWDSRITDPQLIRQIQDHLAAVGSMRPGDPAVRRPVPAPRQRFKRNFNLQTPYGATPACRPTDATDLALEVPFRYSLYNEATNAIARVAVIIHLFHPDMSELFRDKIKNIPVRADVFISTDTYDKKKIIEETFKSYHNGDVDIKVFPNRGRDIAAMLVGYGGIVQNYEVILHIHSKQSPHNQHLRSWRNFLLDNLLGSTDIVQSILEVLSATDVGIVFSQHLPAVRGMLNFGMDFDATQTLLKKVGICLSRDLVLEFPAGSFFWATRRALKPLLDMSFGWSDFPSEPIAADGTLAHAIERSILYLCESTGQRWVKVGRNADGIERQTLVPVCRRSDIETAVTRVHRWITGNPVRPIRAARRLSEINLIPTRRDLTKRPRLNIIVPNLQPHSFFGGLTTAINLFTGLERQLGDTFDYRIISIGEQVTLPAMLRFPEYRLLPLGAVFDQFPKTIVDAGDDEIGELSLRTDDIFIATAWWTAVTAYDLQAAQALRHGRSNPIVYLIQDHEPDFYGWSSRYAIAQETYTCPAEKIAVINSEELAGYMVSRYRLNDVYTLPFTIDPAIRQAIEPTIRERIIVIYGRPQTPRNCFEIIMQGLALWQRTDVNEALHWKIISAGEDYSARVVPDVKNLTVLGKLPLEQYGRLLGRASVGISLMISPHPSYPPLEMAFAGMITISNRFENKDLPNRNPNIISVSQVSAEALSDALSRAVRRANPYIGMLRELSEIAVVPSPLPVYDSAQFALRLSRLVHGGHTAPSA